LSIRETLTESFLERSFNLVNGPKNAWKTRHGNGNVPKTTETPHIISSTETSIQ